MEDFDPVKYGVLWEKVQAMDKKIDKMEEKLEELVELANKSKGGFWVMMGFAGMVGSVVTWMLRDFFTK